MPVTRIEESYTHSDNITYTHGAHELRFGFDLVRHHLNHWQPEIGNGPRGYLGFGGGPTALNGGPAPNQYNGYATFLLGLDTTTDKSLQYILSTGREWQFGWYARDRWQVSRNLTINIGLRYEFYPLMTRAGKGIEQYDPATNQVLLGGRGNTPQNAGITVSHKLFAPRVGLAWRLGDKTVIRAGYGINYDPIPFSRPLRGWYPLVIDAANTAPNGFAWAGTIEQGVPNAVGSGSLHRRRDAAGQRGRAQPLGRRDPPRLRAVVELHDRAQAAAGCGHVGRLTSARTRCTCWPTTTSTPAVRARRHGQPAVQPGIRPHGRRPRCGMAISAPTTIRSRWRSTGPSRRA